MDFQRLIGARAIKVVSRWLLRIFRGCNAIVSPPGDVVRHLRRLRRHKGLFRLAQRLRRAGQLRHDGLVPRQRVDAGVGDLRPQQVRLEQLLRGHRFLDRQAHGPFRFNFQTKVSSLEILWFHESDSFFY